MGKKKTCFYNPPELTEEFIKNSFISDSEPHSLTSVGYVSIGSASFDSAKINFFALFKLNIIAGIEASINTKAKKYSIPSVIDACLLSLYL